MISPSLRMELMQHMFEQVINSNSVFGGKNDALLEFVMNSIKTMMIPPEEVVVQ